MTKEKIIQTDGNGDGYYVALFPHSKIFYGHKKRITSNEAEYKGIELALQKLPKKSKATIQTDSQLVVGQLTEDWKVNHSHLLNRINKINELISIKNLKIKFQWIPREKNISDIVLRRHLTKIGVKTKMPISEKIRDLEKENKELKKQLKELMKK